MTKPRNSDKERLQQLAVSSIATLLLGVAGIVGLKQPEITLWSVFLAGVCYTFAIHKDLRFKNAQTIGIVAVLLVASVSTQIWLVTRKKEKQSKIITTPSKTTSTATTSAPASVANTGTIGTVTITSDGNDVAQSKKTTAKPR